jgi:nitrite reductase/ring-hydroxylating ferredoxin subunit
MSFPPPGWGERSGEAVVVNLAGRIVAFENRCPHTGARLCHAPRERMSLDGRHIRCPGHGALFDAEGLCVKGPCRGERLKKMETA